MYFKSYTGNTELIQLLTELIRVLRNIYWYVRTWTCISILYMPYRAYTDLTDLILTLQDLLLSYGSYSCMKVPVGTISQN